MYAAVRAFAGKGAKTLFEAVTEHKADVEQIMRQIKGFVSYTIIDTADGCISVTVCQDKKGIDENLQKAFDWIAKNASTVGAPTISREFVGPALMLHSDTAKNAIGNI
jgi:hypothetical protein